LRRRQEGLGGIRRREALRLGAALALVLGAPPALAQQLAATKLPRPTPKRRLVALDPGHGGIDPGAIGVSGVFEKDIVFDIAREAARQLDARGRHRVLLTRTGDELVPLHERVARARAAGAELFLSVHADALPDAGMRGASVFTLSEQASDKLAAALAARENKADLIAGIDLSRHSPEIGSILLDLARRQTNNDSIRLARRVVGELRREVRLLHNPQRSAAFAVLKAPDVPSVLVETGCLSHPEEERLLRSTAYQRKLAGVLARAVDAFFEK
jgi:N-acetylmuramoyl-L-alanine amidase